MASTTSITEAEILDRLVRPQVGDLPPEAAKGLLQLAFDREANAEIRKLLRKNNRGTISAEERMALDKYLRVGQFLDLVQAKARVSVMKHGGARS